MADELHTTTGANDDSNEPAVVPAESADPMTPIVAPSSIAKPQAALSSLGTGIIPDNETEFERIQRLKLNTDDAPHSGAINDDIAKILKGVKLPERRDFRAAADKRVPAPESVSISAEEASGRQEAARKTASVPQERDIVTARHTLKDDLQDIVRLRKISLVRASALEQDKKGREAPKPTRTPGEVQRSRRTFAFIFFTFLLIALGAAALYGVFVVMQNRAATPAQQYPSMVFAEQTVTLPIDRSSPIALKEIISQARSASNAPLGSITRIVPTVATTTISGATATEPATLSQFFRALGLNTPDGLLRGLGSTFFFGIHTVDINAPVFVIPVTSYDLAFAGMLAWEPVMNQNLAPAFDAVSTLVTGPDGLPTARVFTDGVLLNYDVRELKDDSGNVILYYSFPTPNILVIAESPHSFTEILSRLEAQREL